MRLLRKHDVAISQEEAWQLFRLVSDQGEYATYGLTRSLTITVTLTVNLTVNLPLNLILVSDQGEYVTYGGFVKLMAAGN